MVKFIIINTIITLIITIMTTSLIIYFIEIHSTHPVHGAIQEASTGRPCMP